MHGIYQYSTNFRNLVADIERLPLVLFVGAGINQPIVPTWRNLLKGLLGRVADRIIFVSGYDCSIQSNLIHELEKYSEYEQATIAKSILGNHYFIYLRSQLYSTFNARNPQGTTFHRKKIEKQENGDPRFLREVTDLCKSPRVFAIVSYNYDDILLNAINESGTRRSYNICGPKTKAIPDETGLPIYYVHGYIPCEGKLPSKHDSMVILSRDEYFKIILQPYSWQTTVQLHFLQNYVALFLGTSLSDWNMMRMLSTAKTYSPLKSVYYITTPIQETDLDRHANASDIRPILHRIRATLLQDMGVKAIVAPGDNYDSIHEIVATLSKNITSQPQ